MFSVATARSVSRLLAAWAACFWLPGAVAQPLTLEAAVRAAQQRSLWIAASDSAVRQAREMAVSAGQRPDPVLRVGVENLPVDGPDRFSITSDFMTMRSIGVMQTFPREAKRNARAARFEREADVASAERSTRSAAVSRDTAIAWFERRAQEQRIDLLRAQVAEAQLQAQAAEAAARGGRGTQGDWIAAREAIVQWQQASIAAETELDNLSRNLTRWTGIDALRPLSAPPSIERSVAAEHTATERIEHHPELLQLAAREAAAAAEAEVARQERSPDWSAELTFSQRGSRYSNMVSIGVSVPVPWDRPQRQDRDLAARLARVQELRDERAEMAREHAAQTDGWIASWRAGLAQLALLDSERLPLARQREEVVLAAYRGGNVSLTQVLEARRMVLGLQLERIGIELDTARMWSRLEYLISGSVAPAAASQGAKP